MTPIADCRLYLCTPDRPDLASFVAACIAGGVDIVQLRDKHLEARPLLERAALVRAVCADAGVPFILNDRPDLALEAGADGVHVGQDDAPVALARRILGADAIIGLSTHGPADLAGAMAIGSGSGGLSYISAGPVEPTPTKPGRAGTGLAYLTQATAAAALPVFVTGGVTPEKIPLLAGAGARHFVVVRYLTEAADPRGAARALRDAIDGIDGVDGVDGVDGTLA
ncbi:MAG: thiamine phosphate synthase [Acidimicrobiales bacterium]